VVAIITASGAGLLSSRLAYLMALAGVGLNMTRMQFQAPSLRDYGNVDVLPINIGAAFESPPRVDDFSRKMVPLAMSEEWDAFARFSPFCILVAASWVATLACHVGIALIAASRIAGILALKLVDQQARVCDRGAKGAGVEHR
jgi:hypothetical protein